MTSWLANSGLQSVCAYFPLGFFGEFSPALSRFFIWFALDAPGLDKGCTTYI